MHKTVYAFAKPKEHDFLVIGSRSPASSASSTSTSQPPQFRCHQDQGMSNKLLVSMKCERLQGGAKIK
jgi:hypothetical protein